MLATNSNNDMLYQQFVSRLPYPPNPFQEAILQSLINGGGHILVSALAGSGKTSLLVQAAQLLSIVMGVKPSEAMFLAFNKKIRDEMNKRLPAGWTAVNSHRLGNSILKKAQPNTDVDFKKYWGITEELINNTRYKTAEGKPLFIAKRMLENLCSKAMLSNLKLLDVTLEEKLTFPDKMMQVAEHFNLAGRGDDGSVDDEKLAMLEDLIELVPVAVQKAYEIWKNTGKVTFDEQLYFPVALNLPVDQYRFVFVDEAQDLNALQQELVFRSCAPDGRMVFCGDRNQAIYGFASADAYSFDNIQKQTNAEVLPLNICYRCPTSHLEKAQKVVPHIEAAPNAKEGKITFAAETNAHKILTPGTLVMCRITAPLVSMYFELIANRVPVKLLGRDIAKMLEGILDKVQKMPGFSYDRCIEYLEEYEMRQIALLQQKEASESQVQQLQDSVECLTVCVENFTECYTMQCLRSELKKLFVDEKEDENDSFDSSKIVTLCTVHRAKGLEAERTAILHPEKMPLVWNGQKPWEFEQEMNILYVALTRSKDELIIFGTPDKLKVDAKPEDLQRNTRRQTERPEEIEIKADVTDHLPAVKLEEDGPIDLSKNRISRKEALEIALLLADGGLGDGDEDTVVDDSTKLSTEEIPALPSNVISIEEVNTLVALDTDDDTIDYAAEEEMFGKPSSSEEPPMLDIMEADELAASWADAHSDDLSLHLPEVTDEPTEPEKTLAEKFMDSYGSHRIDGKTNPKIKNGSSPTKDIAIESDVNTVDKAEVDAAKNRIKDVVQNGLFNDDEHEEAPKFRATGNLKEDMKAHKKMQETAQQPVEKTAVVETPPVQPEPVKITPKITPAPSRPKRTKAEAQKAMQQAITSINDVSAIDALIAALQAQRDVLTGGE